MSESAIDLDTIVEGIPIAACIYRGPRALAVNRRLCALTGYTREEILGSANLFKDFVMPEEMERLAARARARAHGDNVPDDYEFTGRSKAGLPIPARARVSPFPAGGPGAVLWLCTDESERSKLGAIIRLFVDASVAAQHETTEEGVFGVVREKLEAHGLRVSFVELQGGRFRFLPGSSGPFVQAVQALHPGWAELSAFPLRASSSSQGTLIDDLPGMLSQILKRPRNDFAGLAAERAVVTAIPVDGEARYVLACSGSGLDNAIANAFGLFGRQLGAALETARGLTLLRRSNRELLVVNEVASASARLGSGRALSEALQQLVGSLAIDSVALFRRDERELVLLDQQGFDKTWAATAQRLPLGDASPWAEAASSGERVLFALDALGHASPQGARVSASPSCVAIPLRVRDDVNGMLLAVRRAQLTEDDLRTLSTVASQMAVSLENVALLEQAQRRVEELSLLLELGQEILGAPDSGTVLEVAARLFARLLHCPRAYVLLPNASGTSLYVAASAGPPLPDVPLVPLPLDGTSLSARAFQSRAPQSTIDAPHDVRVPQELAQRFQCRSSLAVPLLSHDRPVGVIALIEAGERLFGPEDLRVSAHAAQLVATAIDSARLHEDLRTSYGELARAQAELVSRERLAALGELSASIAHEVRNPLGVIFNSVGSLRRILKPQGDVELLLGIVGEEADRLNRMVGDLLDYSRPLQPALQPVQLRALVEEALESSRKQAGPLAEAVETKLHIGRDVSTVRADERLLRQALVNLFLNAMQAMPRGGRLVVDARLADLSGAAAVKIVIADTGPGVPAEARARIWQPFFTTKATGTGLGLAVVKRIVEGHRGRIELSDKESGAEFRLLLPLGG